jgi:hypothetical protein
MVDRRRADAVDEAAARFAETLAESYRIVYENTRPERATRSSRRSPTPDRAGQAWSVLAWTG